MNQLMRVQLRKILTKHEGYRTFPYIDTAGKISIGIGYNLSDRGLPESWINDQYESDVLYFYNQWNETFDWFKDLNEARQIALIDMSFMGFKKILGFKSMLEALRQHDYSVAAAEMRNSLWARQVKSRAVEIAHIMESGMINDSIY